MNQLKKQTVLIGSPVFQSPNILEAFLDSLLRLKKETFTVDYIFTDDNKDIQSSKLLETFHPKGSTVTILQGLKESNYVCDKESHHWSDALMLRVANYKNDMIEYAKNKDYDYLFFVDSDLILHPNLLEHLKTVEKEVVSEIFWSKWHYNTPFEPNVWLFDEYDLVPKHLGEVLEENEKEKRKIKFLNQLKVPGLYKVGGLGACTLIRRSALLKGVSFSPIKNLTIRGEDRFFCIRAEVLGISLFVDTHYPAYHIYRLRDLPGASDYIQQCKENTPIIQHPKRSTYKITLSMIVRNEENRYLRQLLSSLKNCIDEAVIIDDASTDSTALICREELQGIPLHLITNEESMFSNESKLRKLQWDETVKTNPEWILNLDADEIIESKFWKEIESFIENKEVNAYSFRLYDMWNDTQYREDEFWNAHKRYHTVLIRYQSDVDYKWNDMAQHCGRFPVYEGFKLSTEIPYRIQHYGWAKEEDRLEKKKRYERLDPDALYGIKEQYDSILDSNPNLKEWEV